MTLTAFETSATAGPGLCPGPRRIFTKMMGAMALTQGRPT